MEYVDELAALGTALCWASGSNLFAAAAGKMGSQVLNRLRLITAWVFLTVALVFTSHALWPTWATWPAVAALALSGLVGFVFGDSFGFRSIVILGPGRDSILASTAPFFTTALAWPILQQRPGHLAILGMLLTFAGTALVFTGPSRDRPDHDEGSHAMGIASGLLGALGQAGGYVLSKLALRTGLDPLPANLIRVASATVAIWILAAASREVRLSLSKLRHADSVAYMAAGVALGPVLGVTLSLTALHYIEAGVAASITGVSPMFAMLIAARFHREPLTWRAWVGCLLAIAGVVVLFQR